MPPFSRYKPFVRWWWFGGALEKDEVIYELERMREAGIGGVEIQPVYPMVTGRGHEPANLEWLSDAFLDMLHFAVQEASSMGLTVDLTLGSGWPFGGPHIPKRLAARRLRYDSWDLVGGEIWSADAHPLEEDESLIAVYAAPILEGLIDFKALVEIDDEEWVAPAGEWRVMRYAGSYTRMMVKRATVGAEGWVADHFSREAIELHLREVGDRLVEATEGRVRCFFSDSWEVFGSNWTGDFVEQFRRRRGYDIVGYLPALDNHVKGVSCGARYDYHRTLSELVLESYIVPMREWCNRNGSYSRVQAHGTTPADILKCYGESDVPECETGGWADGTGIGRTPKIASSAARLYGRSEVSCETYTHLRRPRFLVSPRMLKVAADRIYCHGVNHLVYHGYSYSPRRLGSPGWVFYASTVFNHDNTWWPYAKHLNRRNYMLSRELHKGSSAADVLLYASLADVWCKKSTETRPSTLSLLSSQLGSVPESVWSAGYDFDIANDEVIERLRVEGKDLVVGDLSYSIILVPEIDYIPLDTVRKLQEIVVEGGRVLFVNRSPLGSPGGEDSECVIFQKLLREIREKQRSQEGIDPVQPEADIQTVMQSIVPPDLQLPFTDPEVIFIHRRADEEEIYFISNSGAEAKSMEISFRVQGMIPCVVETPSGRSTHACVYRRESERTLVSLSLKPFGSKLLRFIKGQEASHFSKSEIPVLRRPDGSLWGKAFSAGDFEVVDEEGRTTMVQVDEIPTTVRIADWTLSSEETSHRVRLVELTSWTEIDGLREYSGRIFYSSAFRLEEAYLDSAIGLELDLGDVREVATVFVNGRNAGDLWMPPYTVDITELARLGANSIKVEVTNLLINKVLGLPDQDHSDVENAYGKRFPDAKEKQECHPQPSGLLGPVAIRAYRLTKLRSQQPAHQTYENSTRLDPRY